MAGWIEPPLEGLDIFDAVTISMTRDRTPGPTSQVWRVNVTLHWDVSGSEYEFFDSLSPEEAADTVGAVAATLWDRKARRDWSGSPASS